MTRYASGKGKARFESDRSGFTFPYSEGVIEPSTGLFVHRTESDGAYSLGNHPQNFPPIFRTERVGLKNARPLKGSYKDSYLINDWDHSGYPNPDQPLEFDVPMTTEDGSTILIEGY